MKRERGSRQGFKENEHRHIETSYRGHRKSKEIWQQPTQRTKENRDMKLHLLGRGGRVIDSYENKGIGQECNKVVPEGENRRKQWENNADVLVNMALSVTGNLLYVLNIIFKVQYLCFISH